MSEAPKRSVSNPGSVPAAGAPRSPSNPGTLPAVGDSGASPPPRTISRPEALKTISAARAAPPPAAAGPLSKRLKEGVADTALNAVGLLRDTWADFRAQDQYFKYKALILTVWVLLSGAAFVVACPGLTTAPKNPIGARLVTTQVADTPVFMLVNESDRPWEDVVVVVNRTYRAAVARVGSDHPNNTLVLEPKRLLGDTGAPAPIDLKVRELEVRTRGGTAALVSGGRALEED
jgi:hypothetical protein